MDDSKIIRRLRNNNKKALELLMNKYMTYVITIISRIGGKILTNEDIEEITSDVFYSVWKSRKILIVRDSLKPYIAEISRNMTKKKLRICRCEYISYDDDIINLELLDITKDIELSEQVEIIREILKEFTYPDKDILIAYYFYELKLQEISDRFELPLSTVKSKIYRGRKEIVKEYERRFA